MFFARIEVPMQKFVPGQGFVGDHQSKQPFSFDWNENPPTANIRSELLLDHVSQDVILHNFKGSSNFLAIRHWARLQIPKYATVEVKLTKDPTCRLYLYQDQIVLVGLHSIADRAQVLPALEEIIEIFQDELLMQLVLQQLLSYQPDFFTPEDVTLVSTIIDGNSARKHVEELRRLQARILLSLGR